MALDVYGSLFYPFISVQAEINPTSDSNSYWGIQPLNDPPFRMDTSTRYIFGQVNGINYLCTRVSVGQNVMIDRGEAILVTQGGYNYYITTENSVLFTEEPPPP